MDFKELFEYVAWANGRCEEMLVADSDPPGEALALYSHVLAAEHIWLCRMLGKPNTLEVFPKFDLLEAARFGQELFEQYQALLGEGQVLERVVEYTTTEGVAHSTPMSDILMHVVTHGNYHRGQVARIVRQAGGTPVDTDLITWSRARAE